MPLYVRDDEVRRLANLLAQRRNSNVTEALRAALKEALQREEEDLTERRKRLEEILGRFGGPEERPGFSDSDLYDESGTPIL
jgi:antitoxin VapB